MSTATVTLPDSSTYTRKTRSAYTHAAVLSFDRAYAIKRAEEAVDVYTRSLAVGACSAAQLRGVHRALAALRAHGDVRAYEVASLHTSRSAAEAAALARGRKAGCASLVVEVVLR